METVFLLALASLLLTLVIGGAVHAHSEPIPPEHDKE